VETDYVDSSSRDPRRDRTDAEYRSRCEEFGMADGSCCRLRDHATRQLVRNVLVTESVRRGGPPGTPVFSRR
jgi:hypothetical protein